MYTTPLKLLNIFFFNSVNGYDSICDHVLAEIFHWRPWRHQSSVTANGICLLFSCDNFLQVKTTSFVFSLVPSELHSVRKVIMLVVHVLLSNEFPNKRNR